MNTSPDCRMTCENIVVTLVYSNSAKWLWWNDYKVCKAKQISPTQKKKINMMLQMTFDHLYSQKKKFK